MDSDRRRLRLQLFGELLDFLLQWHQGMWAGGVGAGGEPFSGIKQENLYSAIGQN